MTYTRHGVDFEEVRWPRESLSVLSGGSGGREEICMPCLCTQVSHQAWGPKLESGSDNKLLVCEATNSLWLWKFTQGQWIGRRLNLSAD